jgi:tRNA dimethylallyltransferase
LIDLLEPTAVFSAHDFVKEADRVISEIRAKGKLPLVVGGTYFYLKSLQNGMFAIPPIDPSVIEEIEEEYENQENASAQMHEKLTQQDPKTAAQIHPNDRYRILRALAILKATGKQPSSLALAPASPEAKNRLWMKYAMVVPRHELTQLITQRTDQMVTQGLIEETKNLMQNYPNARALGSIGYAESVKFLRNEIDQKTLRNEIIEKTRQLAKRQMTWLRSDPEIRFVDRRDKERIALEVANLKFVLGEGSLS